MTKASQHCAVAPTPVLSGVVLGFARPVGSHHPVLRVHAPLRYSGHRSAPWSQLQAPKLFDLAATRSLRQPPGLSPDRALLLTVPQDSWASHGSYCAVSRDLFWSTGYPCHKVLTELPAARLPALGPRIHELGFHRYGLASAASGPRHDLCGVATLRPPRCAGYPRVCRFTER